MKHALICCAFFGLIIPVAGCSTFSRDWRLAEVRQHPIDGLSGRWEGTWRSDATGHQGRLWCIIQPIARQETGAENADEIGLPPNGFQARFRAEYIRLLRFEYTLVLRGEHHDSRWHLHGKENLGRFAGGEYLYEATVDHEVFYATYASARDRGTFEMRRLSP